MNLLNQFKRLHKWLALIIGIQLLIWVLSGIVFSFIDHRVVDGEFIFKSNQENITASGEFSEILKRYPNATEITQVAWLDKPVFKIVSDKRIQLIDAETKTTITIGAELIKKIATKNYKGGGKLISVHLVTEKTDDNRRFSLPSWQLIYHDPYATHLYFSAETGEYQGIRTNSWRTFDFFMMLHFMDYGDRGNFNHWLIILAALLLLFFAMSGILLIYSSFSHKDFIYIINRFYRHRKFTVTLIDAKNNRKKLKVDKDERLMDALAEYHIELDSACGGGGICGLCRVKRTDKKNAPSLSRLSDHDTLNKDELKQGYRLACQLPVDSHMTIELTVLL